METTKLNFLLVTVMVVALHGAAAKDHIVGGSDGWGVPTDKSFYGSWVTNEGVINVNDVLVFNFSTGYHTVAEVTLAAYDACDRSKPIQMYTDGPARVSLNTPGIHCFICTIGAHCYRFQKMTVTVETPKNLSSAALSHQ